MISVIGSINMDITVFLDTHPQYGETRFGNRVEITPGGKGANQAVACKKLGQEVHLVGCIGQDIFGSMIVSELEMSGIDTKSIIMSEKYKTGSAHITVDNTGENTMVVIRGANQDLCISDIEKNVRSLAKSSVLLVQMEISEEVAVYAMKKAKENGVYVILDPAPGDGYSKHVLRFADLVIPNLQETEFLTGIAIINDESAREASCILRSLGPSCGVIKMAERGSYIYSNDTGIRVNGIRVKAIDTVGAGDCFAGALATSITHMELVDAVRYATFASALKVTRVGAQKGMPMSCEVDAFINSLL